MINTETIKNNISQIFAITEKNVKLGLRFKFKLIFSFFSPIISIIVPIIIMGKFFDFNVNFGPWDQSNYTVYIILAYNIILLQGIKGTFPNQFRAEKYWQTLPALIIAPINRINLLFGIFFSQLIIIFIPVAIFLVLCYIFYPISLITLLFIIGIIFLIALIFSGIGIILGILAISKENWMPIINFSLGLLIMISCISFPFEIFPEIIQTLVNLNPLYHIFYFLRVAWIENNLIFSITSHFFSFLTLIGLAIVLPCIGTIVFNKIYKKYGIVGY
jgi:ABC-type polysaccharide/polyol phosphate export permease